MVALPGSRLLVNGLLLAPGAECDLAVGGRVVHGQFVSVEQKEVGEGQAGEG